MSLTLYYDVTNPTNITSPTLYYDVTNSAITNPATMTSLYRLIMSVKPRLRIGQNGHANRLLCILTDDVIVAGVSDVIVAGVSDVIVAGLVTS